VLPCKDHIRINIYWAGLLFDGHDSGGGSISQTKYIGSAPVEYLSFQGFKSDFGETTLEPLKLTFKVTELRVLLCAVSHICEYLRLNVGHAIARLQDYIVVIGLIPTVASPK
jgi:hypothetical protein